MVKKTKKLVIFEGQQIRRHWDKEKEVWFFAIVDIIRVLTNSDNPQVYWRVLKKRLIDEGSNETVTKCNGLKMIAEDGKMRDTDVADTETILRLIQSIPSPNAEPFKLWLARVGYERIEETENPELAIQRALKTYLNKGYTKDWVNLRLKSIEIRKDLTNEWQNRGLNKNEEFATLTDDITFAWAGLKTKKYKKYKGLKKENLRDNMTNLELILNMLAEESTAQLEKVKNPDNFTKHRVVAREGGRVAGVARERLEKKMGKPVISNQNYLLISQKERKKLKN